MSEEEKLKSIIQEIKDIYLLLTQQEPTPDDEIEAREQLLNKIQSLRVINSSKIGDNVGLFEDTLNKLEKWDTLELWFIESELPEYIRKIINITEKLPEIQSTDEDQESPTTKLREDLESARVDINQIVDKVSKQFKGEIDGLKQEIDVLKSELEKKDKSLKQISKMKVVKKITPKKDVKLPPPKIKIPVIKKPDIIPHITAPKEMGAKKPTEKLELNSIKQVQLKIEEEIEKLQTPIEKKLDMELAKNLSSEDLEPLSKLPEPMTISESQKEKESIRDIINETESSQVKPISEMISELPEKPPSIREIHKISKNSAELTEPPKFTDMPDKPKKSSVIPEIIEIDSEEEKEIPFTIKESKIIEKPEIITQKPKITPVSIEEIEAESIPSTGTNLFNVFSSVGEKTTAKVPTLDDVFNTLPVKEKKKKDEKKKKKEEKAEISKTNAVSFVGFGTSKPKESSSEEFEISTEEELPSDKDSLYQELIALEGKRYSLEKTFKEIEKSYGTGLINDNEYNKQSDDLRGKLDKITSRINRIRRVISSL